MEPFAHEGPLSRRKQSVTVPFGATPSESSAFEPRLESIRPDELVPWQFRFDFILSPILDETIFNLHDYDAVGLKSVLESVLAHSNLALRIKRQMMPMHVHREFAASGASKILI